MPVIAQGDQNLLQRNLEKSREAPMVMFEGSINNPAVNFRHLTNTVTSKLPSQFATLAK